MTEPKEFEVSMPMSDEEEAAGMAPIQPVETNNVRPSCFKTTTQEILFVIAVTMGIGTSALLTGSVTVVSSFIGRDLNMTTAEITWLQASTNLSCGAFLMFFGKVADLFGRKTQFVTAMFLFAIACLGTGFSRNAITVDVLNGVLGLLSACAIPPAQGLLGAVYPKPSTRKNRAFACFSAGNPMGFVFGTIFGGVAASIFNWRATYWLLAIIFGVFSVIALITVPSDTTPKQPFTWETIKRFDFVGTLLTIGGIGMFSAALTLGSSAPQGWKTSYVLALLIIGFAMMVVFVFWEQWFKTPLMPMRIWKDKNFSLSLGCLTVGFMAFQPAAFFLSLYFQDVKRFSPILTAVHLLPMAVVGTLVNIFAAFFLHRISNKLLMYIAVATYAIAYLLFAVNKSSISYWALLFPGMSIMVVGADIEFNVANMYVMSSMPPEAQSIAGGIFQTVTRLCSSIGLGIATAVFSSVQKKPALANYWDKTTQPYAATFWASFAISCLGFILVPFLTISTQGGKERKRSVSTYESQEVTRGEQEKS